MSRFNFNWLILACAILPACEAQHLSDLVDPLVGTAAEGQTFPIAGVPFAMTDWTPQTRDGEAKCVAPYYIADTRIQGFRMSHFMNGSCTQDYGSFTVMPVAGAIKLHAADRSSTFIRATESAHPSEYAVDLADYGIHAQITGTVRSGFMRFRYQRSGPSWLVVQSNSRRAGEGGLHLDASRNELSGENPAHRLYAGNGKPAGFSGYLVMQFDHPIQSSTYWNPLRNTPTGGEHDGIYLGFNLHAGETLQVRIGTSFTSIDEARRNLQAEIPTWNYAATAAAADSAWEKILSAIRIAGNAPERRIFYTALYHSLLLPRTFSDADGSYPSFAGGKSIETAKDFTYYDDFSLWDTFRALHPLLAIIDPHREGDMVASLVAKGSQGGFLPIYPAWNSYTSEMIGDHADAVIADAYAKGIRNFDAAEAYRLMRRNATETPSADLYQEGQGRRALESYLHYGYIPLEDHVPFAFHKDEQVSRTLEYAYDDSLVGKMAQSLGHKEDADLFAHRAENWRNVIDPAVGFARGRHADGSWITPFDPGKPASYVTEGLPFQYTFFVPQNLPGLIQSLGGNAAFIARLDQLFTRGYYDQGNEPSHHIAWLYDYAGDPAGTQQHVRALLDGQYFDRPAGLSGNDDCGQMSAWYVLAALGFYPVAPGTPEYALATPRFDDITLTMPAGRPLHIVARGAQRGLFYSRRTTLNGTVLDRPFLTHQQFLSGGELVFDMSHTPPALK